MDTQIIVDASKQSTFWQANFWGIVGSITGLAGLVISWISVRYNTPKIEVEEAILHVPNWIKKSWGNSTLKELESSVLEFELEIVIRNNRGGSGSIRKPRLDISIPLSKKWFFTTWESFTIEPVTEHFEREEVFNGDGSTQHYKTWTERHGRSFNISGGERVDDRLVYHTWDIPELLKRYIKNMDQANYYIVFGNDRGGVRRMRIKDVRDLHS